MIVARIVFQAHFGRGGDLAARFVEGNRRFAEEMGPQQGTQRRWRILTDLSGDFDTVVFENEAENLAEWEQTHARLFESQTFREGMAQIQGVIVGGRSEFWTVEAEG